MTDSNLTGIVGAGLSIVALGVTAKIAMDMTKEVGKQAKGKQVKYTKYKTGNVSQNAVKKILG